MEEAVGAQYAIHIAVHTLKERCRSLQQRVANLEEENLKLRLESNEIVLGPNKTTHHTCDQLKSQVLELSEQKAHLVNKMQMVTVENQELWNKLSRLTKVNKSLGSELSKINDSLVQHTARHQQQQPLIRSRTFTQEEPHLKVLQRNLDENNKISTELEEISLKLINSLAQGKSELDSLCSDLDELTSENLITDSFGFYYDDNIIDQFSAEIEDSKAVHEMLSRQQALLQIALTEINKLREKKTCDKKTTDKADKGTETEQTEVGPPPVQNETPQKLPAAGHQTAAVDMICPLCCKNFLEFKDLEEHVQAHFVDDTFEVIS